MADENKKVEVKKSVPIVQEYVAPVEPVTTFEAYFEVLKTKNPNIKGYHKKAIEIFMKEKLGGLVASVTAFEEIMAKY